MNIHKFVLLLILLLSTQQAFGLAEEVIRLSPSVCKEPSRLVADGSVPKPADVAKDAYCVSRMMSTMAPLGAVTIFGSARADEKSSSYRITREFARLWTRKFGQKYPILTGGGPGIMEAGNRGASDVNGPSLSISTHFSQGEESLNRYSTHFYVAASFSQREADLVDYAAAIVVAPGGFGTEWEIYESLSKIQTHKKNAAPIVLLGGKKIWAKFLQRMAEMKDQKTIAPGDVDLIIVAESPESAVASIEAFLLNRK